MINFQNIDNQLDSLKDSFETNFFGYCVIDNFLEPEAANRFYDELPDPQSANIGKSRDYVFAKNKFEKSEFKSFGTSSDALYSELLSQRFADILKAITKEEVWVDPAFHGGGLHQGGQGSFLDMHVDFNMHPLHKDWFRNLNILIYLNKDWESGWGGELKLKDGRSGKTASVEPLFNRAVIMHTRDYTLHGYDPIKFPEGRYRRSIAAYAYSNIDGDNVSARSTKWYPENSGFLKRQLGAAWPKLVSLKSKLLGSGTSKNQ